MIISYKTYQTLNEGERLEIFRRKTQKQIQNELAQKMLVDSLVAQLAEAKATAVINEFSTKLDTLQNSLKPTIQFFAEKKDDVTVPKRISKKERERIEFEEYEKSLEKDALAYIKNGGKK